MLSNVSVDRMNSRRAVSSKYSSSNELAFCFCLDLQTKPLTNAFDSAKLCLFLSVGGPLGKDVVHVIYPIGWR